MIDIVERFQLSVFVTIITIRNLVELSAAPPSPFSVYPQSFVPLFSSMTAVARLLTPCFLVLGCETLVDWLKHAFITKFNQIRPSVYGRFVDILSRDLVVGSPARLAGRNNVCLPMMSCCWMMSYSPVRALRLNHLFCFYCHFLLFDLCVTFVIMILVIPNRPLSQETLTPREEPSFPHPREKNTRRPGHSTPPFFSLSLFYNYSQQ